MNTINIFNTLVLPQFLAFIFNGTILFNKKQIYSQLISIFSIGFSCIFAWFFFIQAIFFYKKFSLSIPWINILKINFSCIIDNLTSTMMLIITTISLVVNIYSAGYMKKDKSSVRFFTYLPLFTFFMTILVVSDNLLQLFLGWEGVGLVSYLLISFWHEKPSAVKAGFKAFITNRFADFFLLLGIIFIFLQFESLDFQTISNTIAEKQNHTWQIFNKQFNSIDIICLLITIGCMAKSAQIGLHIWLPDAMEGPTPASALIHAATMVTAGVFLLTKCSFILQYSPKILSFITTIGSLTALISALIAITQNDIKKIIAYSTCSQLGYMFLSCGLLSPEGAMFHLTTHAFYKALLFLCAGNIIHSQHGEQNINKMGGLWTKIPLTYILFLIASLSLMGIFPFSGFFSKEYILNIAYHQRSYASITGLILGIITALATTIYTMKLILNIFHGNATKTNTQSVPLIMQIPLLILATGAIFIGGTLHMLNIRNIWQPTNTLPHKTNYAIAFITLTLLLIGIILSIFIFNRTKQKKLSIIYKILQNKFYFDEIYCTIITKPLHMLCKIASIIDKNILDHLINKLFIKITSQSSVIIQKIQTGYIYHYCLTTAATILLLIIYVIYVTK